MRRLNSRSGQATLIGLLVAVAIIMVAVWFIWLRPQGGVEKKPRFEGEAQTPLGQAMQKGSSVECIEYLRQLRLMVDMQKQETGSYPPALDPKWGVPLKCPVSGYDYKYDPTTGKVWDPTPGHEKY
jgi:hypothetical protein